MSPIGIRRDHSKFVLPAILAQGTLLTRVVEGFLVVFPIDHWFTCVRHGPVVISLRPFLS